MKDVLHKYYYHVRMQGKRIIISFPIPGISTNLFTIMQQPHLPVLTLTSYLIKKKKHYPRVSRQFMLCFFAFVNTIYLIYFYTSLHYLHMCLSKFGNVLFTLVIRDKQLVIQRNIFIFIDDSKYLNKHIARKITMLRSNF